MNWSISYSHFAGDSREFEADTSRDVCNELQRMADSKHVGKLGSTTSPTKSTRSSGVKASVFAS